MTDRPFAGRVALVTGASRGIGAATATALGKAGAHVVLTARGSGGLEEVEEAIHQAGGTATIAPLDLTDGESIGRLAAAVAGRWDALDILVLNAATLGSLSPVPAIDPKEFARVITLNISAQQALIAAFDPLLRASEHARVLALTSSVATKPRAYWGAYGASKAALETLMLAYADEMRAIGNIRVALVNPGATATAMRTLAYPGEDPAQLRQPGAVAEAIVTLLRDDFETGTRIAIGDSAPKTAASV
jgi:NAD(P)-dependent dehydrogenase (short-subunit alcohol dehydrogenase family)